MIVTPPLPWIVRATVPEAPPPLPGHLTVNSRITAGLPHAVALDARLTLGLVAPSGLARHWLAMDGGDVVTDAAMPAPDAPPARLILRGEGNRLLGVAPLALGPARLVAGAADPSPRIRLRVTGWRIHAGSMVGAGDFGSFIAFDWAPWGSGTTSFAAPVARAAVRARLARAAPVRFGPYAAARRANDLAAAVESEPAGTGSGAYQGYARSFTDV